MTRYSVLEEFKRLSLIVLIALLSALFYMGVVTVFKTTSINPLLPTCVSTVFLLLTITNVFIRLLKDLKALLQPFSKLKHFDIPKITLPKTTLKKTHFSLFKSDNLTLRYCVNRC